MIATVIEASDHGIRIHSLPRDPPARLRRLADLVAEVGAPDPSPICVGLFAERGRDGDERMSAQSQELVLLSTWNATLMWLAGLAHEDGRSKGQGLRIAAAPVAVAPETEDEQ